MDGNIFKNIVPTHFKALLQGHVKELAKQKQIYAEMRLNKETRLLNKYCTLLFFVFYSAIQYETIEH